MKFTIFTPTYNRGHLLPQLFNSLESQKNKDFEWLIIDDGSTDDTNEIVGKFIKESSFKITYIYQSNGGKHRAFNRAIKEAVTEWFMCVDSDDPLIKEVAIDNLEAGSKLIEKDDAGFVGICIDVQGNPIENKITKPFHSDTIEIRDKYNYKCEPEVYRTSILKQYSFPEYENEKFITEAILFDKLTFSNKLLYTNLPIQIKEYLPGGLTDRQTEIRIQSPNGTLEYYKQRFHLSRKLKSRIKAIINYGRFYIHAKVTYKKIDVPFFILSLPFFPLSFILFVLDNLKKRK